VQAYKKRDNIKNNLTDPCAIANFNEYANSTESIRIIIQTKASNAVLEKKESISRQTPEKMRRNDTRVQLSELTQIIISTPCTDCKLLQTVS